MPLHRVQYAARFRHTLNFTSVDQREVARVGKNQGLCNAFLAAGVAWGLRDYRRGRPEGRPVLRFFLVFIAVAGVVGWWSIRPDPAGAVAFLVGQTGLALAALGCLRMDRVPVDDTPRRWWPWSLTDSLTAVSIALFTVTWGIAFLQEREDKRVALTATAIENFSTNGLLAEANVEVTRLVNAGAEIRRDGIDPKREGHVIAILDYYEYLSDLHANGALSERTLLELRARLMRRTWAVCAQYIDDSRKAQNRPKLYSGFENFVKKLPPEYQN